MKNRFLTIFLLVCVIISSLSGIGFAETAVSVSKTKLSDETALLKALHLLSDEVMQAEDDAVINRGQLAFSCAGLLHVSGLVYEEAFFTDVPQEHPYFEAIEILRASGLIAGKDAGLYHPEAAAAVDETVKILTGILGYGDIAQGHGGYPEGYRKVAANIGLYRNAYGVSGTLTKKNLVALVYAALMAEAQTTLSQKGVAIGGKDKETLLETNFRIYKYTGRITKVNAADYTVTVEIEKRYHTNKAVGYAEGEQVILGVSTDIDINLYEDVPMDFWVNEDEDIILMLIGDGVRVEYRTIYAVNDDVSAGHKYRADAIREIALLDDETIYDVDRDFYVKYNGDVVTGSVDLIGQFAKVVIENDSILFVESWDLTEGGIITEISYENISYVKGESNCIFEDFHRFENRVIIIDGEGATVEDMKPGACFAYYASKDKKTLVIAMSDIVITDVLYGYDETGADIGNTNFDVAQHFYCFTSLSEIRKETEMSKLLNLRVSGHLDHTGRIAYLVMSEDEAQKLADKEFFGYLRATKTETFGAVQASIIVLRDEPKEIVFNVAEKLRESVISAACGSLSGNSLYKFTLNQKSEIADFEPMQPYYGFGDARIDNVTSFIQSGNPHMYVNGTRLFFDNNTLIYAIYEYEGEQLARRLAWSELSGASCSDVVMNFYGEYENSDVSMILLSGDVESISLDSSAIYHGVVEKKAETVNDEGEECYKLTVNGKEYVVAAETGAKLAAPCYIRYSEGSFFSDSEIDILEVIPMEGSFSDWGSEATTTKLRRGTVKKLDGKRLYLEDGSVYFLYPGKATYIECSSKNTFKKTTYQAIGRGEDVVFSVNNDCVYVVLYR